MAEPYRVLIVEDDFRIAGINRSYVEQDADFTVSAAVRSAQEALAWLAAPGNRADLVLLDVYLPDSEGLSLLWDIRRQVREVDIVMITAAKEVEVIQEALRGGAFDYLIKPTDARRVQKMLARYRAKRHLVDGRRELSQDELDAALMPGAEEAAETPGRRLPKGIDGLTLAAVVNALRAAETPITAAALGSRIGASRSTARRYLEYLVAERQVAAELSYGEVGRPQRQYRLAQPIGALATDRL